jgi:ribonuclease HI
MAKKIKYYTVWKGRVPGIYHSWEECKAQVDKFEGAIYKSFSTEEEAKREYLNKSEIVKSTKLNEAPQAEFISQEEPLHDTICVDGAWNTKTNAMEYQGVLYPSRHKIFHSGPYESGTNNIAEFLAIVHALTYCQKHPEIKIIYSDSQTAITWVKNKRAKTKIADISMNTKIISIVHRGETWLENNAFTTKILKWKTNVWGENPADFGRK